MSYSSYARQAKSAKFHDSESDGAPHASFSFIPYL